MKNMQKKTPPGGESQLGLAHPSVPSLGTKGGFQYRRGEAPKPLGIQGKSPPAPVYPDVNSLLERDICPNPSPSKKEKV